MTRRTTPGHRRRTTRLPDSTSLGAGGHVAALAQTFPDKPINWIVGWPPGGSADATTRLVARKLEKVLGQPVVVENKAGAGGQLAAQALKLTPKPTVRHP